MKDWEEAKTVEQLPEREARLYRKYPMLMKHLTDPANKSCMAFGICWNEGWDTEFEKLCEQLEELNRNSQASIVCFDQCKEKYGEMTIYWSIEHKDSDKDYCDMSDSQDTGLYSDASELINKCEQKCNYVCEDCGSEDGVKNKPVHGWFRTLCKACREKQVKRDTFKQ